MPRPPAQALNWERPVEVRREGNALVAGQEVPVIHPVLAQPAVREGARIRTSREPQKDNYTETEQPDPASYKIANLFPHNVQPIAPALVDKFLSLHSQYLSRNPYTWRDPKVLIGVEVEVENVLAIDPNIPLCFWQVTEDNSLRNHGREFKSRPMPLQCLEPALNQLFSGLNSDIDFSKRTSIHYHFDVRHMTLEQVVSLALSTAAVENLLFKFVGGGRRKNIFCVPITETNLLSKQKGDVYSFIANIRSYWQKYTALNLLPIENLGTVEFRHMPGTNDIRKLLVWADLLSRLRVFAYKNSLKNITTRISSLNTTSQYRQFVEEVFEDLAVFLDLTNLAQDMDKPVYLIKNSTMSNPYQPWLYAQPITADCYFKSIFKDATKTKITIPYDQLPLHTADLIRTWFGIHGRRYAITPQQFYEYIHTAAGAAQLQRDGYADYVDAILNPELDSEEFVDVEDGEALR